MRENRTIHCRKRSYRSGDMACITSTTPYMQKNAPHISTLWLEGSRKVDMETYIRERVPDVQTIDGLDTQVLQENQNIVCQKLGACLLFQMTVQNGQVRCEDMRSSSGKVGQLRQKKIITKNTSPTFSRTNLLLLLLCFSPSLFFFSFFKAAFSGLPRLPTRQSDRWQHVAQQDSWCPQCAVTPERYMARRSCRAVTTCTWHADPVCQKMSESI